MKEKQSKWFTGLPIQNNTRNVDDPSVSTAEELLELERSFSDKSSMNLASSSNSLIVLIFVGGELLIYLIYKIVRGEFLYWARMDFAVTMVFSLFTRVFGSVIVSQRPE